MVRSLRILNDFVFIRLSSFRNTELIRSNVRSKWLTKQATMQWFCPRDFRAQSVYMCEVTTLCSSRFLLSPPDPKKKTIKEKYYIEIHSYLTMAHHKLTGQQIRDLWKDPDSNPAAFSGLITYLHFLKHDKGVDISLKRLKDIMCKESTYFQNALRVKKFEMRPYYVHG